MCVPYLTYTLASHGMYRTLCGEKCPTWYLCQLVYLLGRFAPPPIRGFEIAARGYNIICTRSSQNIQSSIKHTFPPQRSLQKSSHKVYTNRKFATQLERAEIKPESVLFLQETDKIWIDNLRYWVESPRNPSLNCERFFREVHRF